MLSCCLAKLNVSDVIRPLLIQNDHFTHARAACHFYQLNGSCAIENELLDLGALTSHRKSFGKDNRSRLQLSQSHISRGQSLRMVSGAVSIGILITDGMPFRLATLGTSISCRRRIRVERGNNA